MPYNPHRHHRRSIRLKGYDYAQAGLYFITICVKDRWDIFGNIENGSMKMNAYGATAMKQWLKTEEIRDNCSIHDSIIMPNHLHGIIEIRFKKGDQTDIGSFKSPSQTIGSIIRGFKIATIKQIKDLINKNSGESESSDSSDSCDSSTGELQFAPTSEFAPTAPTEFAPTAPTEIIKSLDFKIWQRNYYEHIIRNEKAYNNIAAYINNNPKKWEEDKFYKNNL